MKKSILSAAALALAACCGAANAGCGLFTPQADASVAANSDGTFSYQFDVTGDSGGCGRNDVLDLTDFYLPYFSDMGLAAITASADWTFSIEPANDVFGIGGGAIHFHTDDADALIADFGFQAGYAGTEGPFENTLRDRSTGAVSEFFGDPLIPGSPDTLEALSAVPEPGSLAAMLAGLALIGAVAKRRGSSK